MRPSVVVLTTALVAMPWLAGVEDAGRRPTPTTAIAANNPAIQPSAPRPVGSPPLQTAPQPIDPDAATRPPRTIIFRPNIRTEVAPAQPERPPHAEIPSSKPPSQFRQIYFCDEKDPVSASALGEITDLKTVTVVGPGGKSAAAVKEILPEETFGAGIFHGRERCGGAYQRGP
jgi:hypothetical protein